MHTYIHMYIQPRRRAPRPARPGGRAPGKTITKYIIIMMIILNTTPW